MQSNKLFYITWSSSHVHTLSLSVIIGYAVEGALISIAHLFAESLSVSVPSVKFAQVCLFNSRSFKPINVDEIMIAKGEYGTSIRDWVWLLSLLNRWRSDPL